MLKKDGKKSGHAVALFSGGLDSALAILMLLKQNIEVTALTFMTHFGCDLGDRSSCGSNPYPAAEKYGFNVKLMHLGEKFIDIVENPQFGRGKHMNVCTDCRILMLNEAKELMNLINADFIITGEVLGQRPMSQIKSKMNLIEKETNLKGKLLRPLSAKLLSPTDPELNGMIDRNQLESIKGRSRKRQLEMAKEFGLDDYPSPASGCLLTDEGYSNRLRDLLAHTDYLTFEDLNLLRIGRHFRLDNQTKVIVGRNEKENNQLVSYKRAGFCYIEAMGIGSPITVVIGDASFDNLQKAAMITARYTTAKNSPEVEITILKGSDKSIINVSPAKDEDLSIIAIR